MTHKKCDDREVEAQGVWVQTRTRDKPPSARSTDTGPRSRRKERNRGTDTGTTCPEQNRARGSRVQKEQERRVQTPMRNVDGMNSRHEKLRHSVSSSEGITNAKHERWGTADALRTRDVRSTDMCAGSKDEERGHGKMGRTKGARSSGSNVKGVDTNTSRELTAADSRKRRTGREHEVPGAVVVTKLEERRWGRKLQAHDERGPCWLVQTSTRDAGAGTSTNADAKERSAGASSTCEGRGAENMPEPRERCATAKGQTEVEQE
ncbi:hypothetical protein FB451DRAFT_1195382 [Mycena latifolia]|nr:hypothetical protein FB451DRAFT_1195382 [Mycena latifolia]